MIDAELDRWLDAHASDLIEDARALIAIPSEQVPPGGHEWEVQQHVASRLRALGATVDVFSPTDVVDLEAHPAFSPTIDGRARELAGRPNVVGTFRGSGGGRSVILSTHADTVPAGTGWSQATAFGGEVIGGRLYGRGAYDTKAALASHLWAVECLRQNGVGLEGDVIVESVVDEEFGGSHGVLAARLRGYQADVAINSEPTGLAVCPVHRGGREAYLRFLGDPGMNFGGQQSVDPVGAVARAIVALEEFNRDRNGRRPRGHADRIQSDLPLYFNQIGGGGTSYDEAVGIPADSYVHLWIEVDEGTSAEDIDAELIARASEAAPGLRIKLEPTTRFMPGSSMPSDHPALEIARLAFDGLSGREYRVSEAPFACDAYVFNLHSRTPAFILGPGGGNAHAPDEFVLIQDLVDLAKLCARFLYRWCGSDQGRGDDGSVCSRTGPS